jgi:hypothetical protein
MLFNQGVSHPGGVNGASTDTACDTLGAMLYRERKIFRYLACAKVNTSGTLAIGHLVMYPIVADLSTSYAAENQFSCCAPAAFTTEEASIRGVLLCVPTVALPYCWVQNKGINEVVIQTADPVQYGRPLIPAAASSGYPLTTTLWHPAGESYPTSPEIRQIVNFVGRALSVGSAYATGLRVNLNINDF